MVLKEAYHLCNYLNGLWGRGILFLDREENIMSTKEEHMKHKANPKDEDEVIEVEKEVDFSANDVIDFLLDVAQELEALNNAIFEAKDAAKVRLEQQIAMNKKRQKLLMTLNHMASLKSKKTKQYGNAYMLNEANEQKPYRYEVVSTSVIDFDRNKVKALARKLTQQTTETSNEIDKLNVTTEVDFASKYDVNDSFEDCLEVFLTYEA